MVSLPLFVTVDLGWPWWVSTAIALGVAAVCAFAFVRFRGLVRGAAATLVVEGIVIAAISPAVMGSTGGSSSPMSAPRLTSVEFAHRADANCRSLNGQLAPLGNPKTLPGIARKLDVVVPKFSAALRSQGALRPPADEESLAGQWMQAMTRYGQGLAAVRAAASSGNSAGVSRANARVGAAGGDAARLSKQLGLTYCFQ